MSRKDCIFMTVIAVMICALFITIVWQKNVDGKFFVLTKNNIENQDLVNDQVRISVDLTEVNIPPHYFSGNNCLKEIEIFSTGDYVVSIGRAAFSSARKLKSIKIYSSNLNFPEGCFLGLSENCILEFNSSEECVKKVLKFYETWGLTSEYKVRFRDNENILTIKKLLEERKKNKIENI